MSEGPDAEVGGGTDVDSIRTVLRNTSFRNLLLASVTSSMGDWIGLFALIALAETLEGATKAGALAVSFVMIARIVPTLFFAPVAGVFVDRWDRKRTMVVTDIVRGAIMLLVPFVDDVFQLVIATFVIELASSVFIPAKDAVVPTIVPKRQLVTANQLSLMSTYVTLPIGALLCAVVIGFTARIAPAGSFFADRPESVPILLNALSFFLSILFLRRMDVPADNVLLHEERTEPSSALTDLREGFAFIAGMPLIRALIVGVMAAFLAAGAVIGVGKFFATITNAGEAGFAMLGFIVGFGLVLGIAIAGRIARHVSKERLFAPGIVVAGLMLVLAALMPTLWLASVPVLLMGLGSGVSFITGYTMLQEYSEDAVRGRVFATFNTAIRAALFATLVLGPLMIFVLGVERTQSQIDAGQVVDDIEDFGELDEVLADDVYPYAVGGVRITLIAAGLLAMTGAAWSGLQIAGAFRDRRDGAAGPQTLAPTADAARVRRGLFLAFEGGEGAGKSTQVGLLRRAIERAGYEVVVTREPGGTSTGERVREVLLDVDGDVTPRAEALLYAAARAQHTAELLRPALSRGAVVLCDRFVDSSIVYQGVARGLGERVVAELNRWATDDLQPDLVVLLDVAAEEGLARAGALDAPDRLEAEGVAFHQQVNAAFRRRALDRPERFLIVDATLPVDEVQQAIRARLRTMFEQDGIQLGPDLDASPDAPVAPVVVPDAPVEPVVVPDAPVAPVAPLVVIEPSPAPVIEPPAAPAVSEPVLEDVDVVGAPVTDSPSVDASPDAPAGPGWLRLPDEPAPPADVAPVRQDVPPGPDGA